MHSENYGVYGIRKMHAQLVRAGVLGASEQRPVARCTTQRLMKQLGLRGISRAKGPRTTVPGSGPDTRPDLVERQFTADGARPAVGRGHHLLPHLADTGVRDAQLHDARHNAASLLS